MKENRKSWAKYNAKQNALDLYYSFKINDLQVDQAKTG